MDLEGIRKKVLNEGIEERQEILDRLDHITSRTFNEDNDLDTPDESYATENVHLDESTQCAELNDEDNWHINKN